MLFITHESTRTGAPIVLLELLRWLHAERDLAFEVLTLRHGPLDEAFAELGPLHVLDAGPTKPLLTLSSAVEAAGLSRSRHLTARALVRATRAIAKRVVARRLRLAGGFSLVYANSAYSAAAFPHLPDGLPVISHVHELEQVLSSVADDLQVELYRRPQRFIAAAACVKENLCSNHGIPAARVDVCHEFISLERIARSRSSGAGGLRAALGLVDDTIIVGGSGMRGWRKGIDLFVQVAAALRRRRPHSPVHFVWVGGEGDGVDSRRLLDDIERLAVGDIVHLLPETSSPHGYFAAFDMFALTSREDPFPLVCLEAAALGIPVVSFDCGGPRELIEHSQEGRLVPPGDVGAMAAAVIELADDESLRHELGSALRRKVEERYSVERIPSMIAAVIERTLAP